MRRAPRSRAGFVNPGAPLLHFPATRFVKDPCVGGPRPWPGRSAPYGGRRLHNFQKNASGRRRCAPPAIPRRRRRRRSVVLLCGPGGTSRSRKASLDACPTRGRGRLGGLPTKNAVRPGARRCSRPRLDRWVSGRAMRGRRSAEATDRAPGRPGSRKSCGESQSSIWSRSTSPARASRRTAASRRPLGRQPRAGPPGSPAPPPRDS